MWWSEKSLWRRIESQQLVQELHVNPRFRRGQTPEVFSICRDDLFLSFKTQLRRHVFDSLSCLSPELAMPLTMSHPVRSFPTWVWQVPEYAVTCDGMDPSC